MFRELLQNSDDASSKAVEIRFESKKYIDREELSEDQDPPVQDKPHPDLMTTLVRGLRLSSCSVGLIGIAQVYRWTFKNDGITFRKEDWDRLKRIGA